MSPVFFSRLKIFCIVKSEGLKEPLSAEEPFLVRLALCYLKTLIKGFPEQRLLHLYQPLILYMRAGALSYPLSIQQIQLLQLKPVLPSWSNASRWLAELPLRRYS